MEYLWVVLFLLLRWAHVLPAAILVGAAIYARLAVMPTLEEAPEEQRLEMRESLARRWSMIVGICAGLLLLTGLVNAGLNLNQYRMEPAILYHSLIMVKLILALVVLYIASMLTGGSENAKAFRDNGKFWLTLNCWLGITLVLVGGGMKLIDRKPKPPSDNTPPPVVAPETPQPASP